MLPLWLRSLLMALLLPGIVAGVIPYQISSGRLTLPLQFGFAPWLGWLIVAVGLVIVLLTIWDFLRVGYGTLAPWDAPSVLVHRRLYRWTRNPMYLGVLGCILGQGLVRQSGGVLAYFVVIAVAFHLRVRYFEEPALQRQFGSNYSTYLNRVPRWIPRPPQSAG